MSRLRHMRIVPVFYRGLALTKQFGFLGNSLMMDHLGAVMDHTRGIGAGYRGGLHRKYRQHRYYDGDNHPHDTHGGLPDIGPWEWMESNYRRAR